MIWLVRLGILVLIVASSPRYLRIVGKPEERCPPTYLSKHASVIDSCSVQLDNKLVDTRQNKHTLGSSRGFSSVLRGT